MLRRHFSENAPAAFGAAAAVPAPAATSGEPETPSRPASGPGARLGALSPSRWLPTVVGFAREQRHWGLFLLPYLAAWWQPVYWCVREERLWGVAGSALFFQPFVPLGVVALAWQDRARFAERWAYVRRSSGERSGRRRTGSPLLLALGCLLLLCGQFVHVASIVIIGLLLIGAGALLRVYGPDMMRLLARPLLFSLLMVPTPASPIGRVDDLSQKFMARLAAVVLRLFGKGTAAFGSTIRFPDRVFPLSFNDGGLGIAVTVAAALLFVAVWRRMRPGPALLLMAAGVVAAVALCLPRVMLAAVVAGSNESLGRAILKFPPWVTAVAALALVLFLERRSRPAQAWLAARFRGARSLGVSAERATNRVTSRAAERMGGVTRAAGSSTDMIERGFKALDKLFKAKRRRGRRRW